MHRINRIYWQKLDNLVGEQRQLSLIIPTLLMPTTCKLPPKTITS